MSIIIDFETFNTEPISAGASKYSLTAEILCLAYSLDEGKTIHTWRPGEPDPKDLFDLIELGEVVFAHTYGFEKAIWRNVMVAKYVA